MSNLANTHVQNSTSIVTQENIQLIKDMYCRGASDDEFKLFVSICNKTGLNPLAKQCWAVKRWDASLGREVISFQTGVDGFRVIAQRSEKYQGQVGPFWCDESGEWKDVWLKSTPPIAAKVGVLRSDFKEPLYAVAKFTSYAAKKKDGSLTPFWLKMPDLMIAKVAECLALRKAFPQDLSGIYSNEEMEQAVDVVETKSNHNVIEHTSKVVNQAITQVHSEQSTQSGPKQFPDKTNNVVKPHDDPHVIQHHEIAHMVKEKEQSHIIVVKENVPRFPDKSKIIVTKEQIDLLFATATQCCVHFDDVKKLGHKYKVERWGNVTQDVYENILSEIQAMRVSF